MGKQLKNMELVPVKIRQVQNVEIRQVQTSEQEEEFQKVHDAIRGRVDLEIHILLREHQEHADAAEGLKAIMERFGTH